MAKKINIVGAKPKRIEIVDQPKRRMAPAELAAALGADPGGQQVSVKLDAIALAELGMQLLHRLRSSGGRPALSDATETCRVPLSVADVKALEQIMARVEESTGARPSIGQLVSVIVRSCLPVGETESPDKVGELVLLRQEVQELRERNALLEQRIAEIAEICK